MADKLEGEAPSGRAREASGKVADEQAQRKRPQRKREVPDVSDDMAGKFVRVGNRLYRSADERTPVVKLEPDRLKTRNIDALPDIVRIAKANGWTSIRIEGGDRFRQAAFLAAAAQGLDIENYAPSKRLQAEAERLRERFARREAARDRKADKTAPGAPGEGEQRRQLAERFLRQSARENARDPALKAAQTIVAQTIVAQTLAIARARHNGDAERAVREGEAKRQEVAARIARGDRIAGIETRTRPAPAQTRESDRPGRSR